MSVLFDGLLDCSDADHVARTDTERTKQKEASKHTERALIKDAPKGTQI